MTAIIAVTPVVFYSTPLRMQKHSEPEQKRPDMQATPAPLNDHASSPPKHTPATTQDTSSRR